MLDARLTPKGKEQCRNLREDIQKYMTMEKSSDSSDRTRDMTTEKDVNVNLHDLHHLLRPNSNGEIDVCVVTSPMSRCVETSLLSFGFLLQTPDDGGDGDKTGRNGKSVPFLAHESLRETVNFNCDRRRPISHIAQDFPQVDFSHCKHEEDMIWSSLLSLERHRQEFENDGHMESAELHLVSQRGIEAFQFLQSLPYSTLVLCTHSAYLRCILSWGHPGGVPLMVEQKLDQREDPKQQDKVLEYSCIFYEEFHREDDPSTKEELETCLRSFEEYMRNDYANAELRSFCLLIK